MLTIRYYLESDAASVGKLIAATYSELNLNFSHRRNAVPSWDLSGMPFGGAGESPGPLNFPRKPDVLMSA